MPADSFFGAIYLLNRRNSLKKHEGMIIGQILAGKYGFFFDAIKAALINPLEALRYE